MMTLVMINGRNCRAEGGRGGSWSFKSLPSKWSFGRVCVRVCGRGVWLSPFPFDWSPSSFPQLDAHRPSHQPASGFVSQSGTCMITNSWKSKKHWVEGVGEEGLQRLGVVVREWGQRRLKKEGREGARQRRQKVHNKITVWENRRQMRKTVTSRQSKAGNCIFWKRVFLLQSVIFHFLSHNTFWTSDRPLSGHSISLHCALQKSHCIIADVLYCLVVG